jgi:YD repeat-containing protein
MLPWSRHPRREDRSGVGSGVSGSRSDRRIGLRRLDPSCEGSVDRAPGLFPAPTDLAGVPCPTWTRGRGATGPSVSGYVPPLNLEKGWPGPPSPVGPAPAGAPAPPQTTVESSAGLVSRETDPDGVVTTYDWDATTRRLRSQTTAPATPDAATTRFTYTPAGWLASVTDPLGTTYDYDGAGRQTLRRDPDGAEWRTEYDGSGRVTATVDPLGNRATSRYDATHRAGGGAPR